uniref:DUF38 domain-containing protein n=1 Tax=Panagrolaimus davidi TaxID=227884 RepID=A0A914Q9R1_9BILA
MDISGVSKSDQSNENIKSKASMIQSKRAKFYPACFRQDFSLSNNIIYYILKNPNSAKLYQKMIQTCKYFFIKNPIIVIDSRLFIYDENNWYIICKPYDISKVTFNFWITNNLIISPKDLTINEKMDKTFVSSIIPKLYKCAPKYLTLYHQNIFFRDLSFFISSAEKIQFISVCVKNDDGSNVAVEKIVEIAVKAKKITFRGGSMTSETMKELLKIPNFLKLVEFFMTDIHENFDLETFYNYMKKNKATKIWLRFDNQISEAYKNRIETIIDEIITTKEFIYKPPMIYFSALDHEKFETLRTIYFS